MARHRGRAHPQQASEKQKIARALTLSLGFLYDEFRWALSSAVRAFGLHPKGRPFESDSAHHPFQQLALHALSVNGPIVRVLSVFPAWLWQFAMRFLLVIPCSAQNRVYSAPFRTVNGLILLDLKVNGKPSCDAPRLQNCDSSERAECGSAIGIF